MLPFRAIAAAPKTDFPIGSHHAAAVAGRVEFSSLIQQRAPQLTDASAPRFVSGSAKTVAAEPGAQHAHVRV